MSTYQVRYDGGALKYFDSFDEAIKWTRENGFDKLSFAVEGGRLILRSDGRWEYWDEGFFLQQVGLK